MSDGPDAGRAGSTADESARGEGRLLPVDYKRLRIATYTALMGWLLYLLYVSREWGWEDRLFPQLVGGAALALVATILFSLLFERRFESLVSRTTSPTERETDGSRLRRSYEESLSSGPVHTAAEQEKLALYMIAWCVSLPATMYYVGFVPAIALFVLLFDYSMHGRAGRAVALALGFTLLMYVFFVVLLGAHMWEGAVDFGIALSR